MADPRDETPTLSRTRLVEGLAHKLFNLYLIHTGGMEKQAYVSMLWMSGRLDELNTELQTRLDRLTGGGE